MKKFFVDLFHKLNTRLNRILLLIFGVLLVLAAVGLLANSAPKYLDNDPDRGATLLKSDLFGDHFEKVVYLDQGWNNAQSLWFYNTTQGSDLLPYDFYMVLEKAESQELFHSDENMNGYRYLPQKSTFSNPDALPVGIVADNYKNKKYMGFTCAACHTAQVNYNGTGMRIDGGATTADAQSFILDLGNALYTTKNDDAKKKRFVAAVLSRGNYRNEDEVLADLSIFALRIGLYNLINEGTPSKSSSEYGYARLDAFGRIFNRVLEHVLSEDNLRDELKDTLTPEQLKTVLPGFERVLSDQNRDHILEHLAVLLTPDQQKALAEEIFNPANAPVSYPFLWDTPQHDYVQWNGIGANAGQGPLGRNTGEVLGVFGTLDWAEKPGWTIASVLAGQGFGETYINFDSSINLHNLNLLESQLSTLESPVWPQDILPKLDEAAVERGQVLFEKQQCAACHQPIVRDDPTRHVIANFSAVSVVGTDPTMATNVVSRTGFSGILTNQYQGIGVGSIYFKGRVPAFALVGNATVNAVLETAEPDKSVFERLADKIYDTFFIAKNTIQPSLKTGNYVPDTTTNPLNSLMAYKARSLNGIWATAPYLHNGSVPTLYDILLPASNRPKKFITGSREFDPSHVGLKSEGYEGFVFDTSQKGNSNAGHEYGTYDITLPDGTILKALTEEERLDLLEYLKSQ